MLVTTLSMFLLPTNGSWPVVWKPWIWRRTRKFSSLLSDIIFSWATQILQAHPDLSSRSDTIDNGAAIPPLRLPIRASHWAPSPYRNPGRRHFHNYVCSWLEWWNKARNPPVTSCELRDQCDSGDADVESEKRVTLHFTMDFKSLHSADDVKIKFINVMK